ncbi:CPBP family intramembrane glutamic endopeptidase [Microbacterium sp. H1-D42]|uniref:CPBP family intramembrane glutamic endopeptidase n=1 Tax=Microbacterium sp. H1-D42 TaxID=2925844 RepID=UPI001F52FEAD|nr:CPBP family intramembrane glutamic endopeptidase [Microbacterium sp. H1-D42]UNK71878.1 CPBP family intramembrane metalloprotease [Microbacterium sp. H1-D42]
MVATTRTTPERGDLPVRPGLVTTGWAVGLPLLRIALVAIASMLVWLIAGAQPDAFPPSPLLSSIAMLPVNIICLLLVMRLVRREGGSVRAMLGWQTDRIWRDLAWGLLWLAVMYLPFVGVMIGIMALRFGPDLFDSFETVFVSGALPDLPLGVWGVLGAISALTFAPLNAPAEELVYRGYAQGRLARRLPQALAIAIPAMLFGIQHIWYAPTPDAVLIFVCCFTIWGLISGLIYRWQGRLMPLVFAHGLVNLAFTLPALFIPFMIGA